VTPGAWPVETKSVELRITHRAWRDAGAPAGVAEGRDRIRPLPDGRLHLRAAFHVGELRGPPTKGKLMFQIGRTIAVANTVLLIGSTSLAGAAGFGTWTTGRETSHGRPTCTARLFDDRRAVELYYDGDGSHQLLLMKKGWKVPVGQIFDVSMLVDTNVADAHEFVADAFTVKKIVGGLRIDIDTDLDSVTSQLTRGSTVHFFFPDSSEPEWTGSLRGSGAAVKSWTTCVNKSKAVAPPKVDLSIEPDWEAVAADRIVGAAVEHIATTGGKLSPDAVASEAKRRATAEGKKLGEVDYDKRIAYYLIALNARKLKCANDGLTGSMNDAIEKLTGEPKRELAAEDVTLNVDWNKLGLDELERFRESAGRRVACGAASAK
jgi:hypothetical protein